MTVILIAATVVAPIISALVNVVKEQFGLNGKLVSGLHIVDNLQVIPWYENLAKGNNFEVA